MLQYGGEHIETNCPIVKLNRHQENRIKDQKGHKSLVCLIQSLRDGDTALMLLKLIY